jgi:hypothetical protein
LRHHSAGSSTALFGFVLGAILQTTYVSAAQGTGNGLGPRFNSNQCASCHLQPTAGGSSPPQNPLIAVATTDGAANTVPWFIAPNGPIREARFVQSNGVKDGGVHNLFVVSGRADAGACNIVQPNFLPAGNPLSGQGGNPNIVFGSPRRFTAPDSLSANDGTITRFGWKAQNKPC